MISIIVPHHDETIAKMNPLLSSLNAQVGIDFNNIELLIINDDENHALKSSDLSDYRNLQPISRFLFNKKQGYMGISRQIGIDNAKGEYLLFFDADDAAYCNTLLYDALTRNQKDVYVYKFIEQREDMSWYVHEHEFTWMFAKLYRKKFLDDHNVRFHEDLLWHEDTYFNQVMLAYNPTVEMLESVSYMWLYSENTITRRNNAEYTSKSMCIYIDALHFRLLRIKDVVTKEKLSEYVFNDIAYMYAKLQTIVQMDILDEVRKDIEDSLAAYILFWDNKLSCTKPENLPIMQAILMRCMMSNNSFPQEGFVDCVNRIVCEKMSSQNSETEE